MGKSLAAKEHKERKKGTEKQPSSCFVEALFTGRHEIMKTGRKRRLTPSHVHFHVFLFSC
jgi:diadenosine tetraphosphate (Ap4A) HIT family hydrolase